MRNINEPLKRDTDTDITPKDRAEKARTEGEEIKPRTEGDVKTRTEGDVKTRTEGDVLAFRRDKLAKESQTSSALFPEREAQTLHSRWDAVQSTFVDEPRKAVEDANDLVASAIQRLSQVLSDERSRLESGLKSGDEVSTEDLRLTLQRYRVFFSRLLSF